MRKSLIAASLLSLTVAMAPACATKKYVRTEVGGVNSKVDTLSGTLEQTQGRIQQDETRIGQNETKIGQVDQKAEAAGQSAQAAQNTATAAQTAARQVGTRVDQVVGQLKGQQGKDVYIEIEGHTDNVGDKTTNERIGLARAEAVKKYLYEQYQIPLHKMNVISYGKDKPIAPNKTKAGRAQNRRVVIKVLA